MRIYISVLRFYLTLLEAFSEAIRRLTNDVRFELGQFFICELAINLTLCYAPKSAVTLFDIEYIRFDL